MNITIILILIRYVPDMRYVCVVAITVKCHLLGLSQKRFHNSALLSAVITEICTGIIKCILTVKIIFIF
jgi:hypothetical protein